MGQWVGYGKYVFSTAEKEQYRLKKRLEWDSKWVTVWRLKNQRLWTDKLIKDFLGKPIQHGKYKVFTVEDVKSAEKKKKFKEIMVKRIEKKKLKNEFVFLPPKL